MVARKRRRPRRKSNSKLKYLGILGILIVGLYIYQGGYISQYSPLEVSEASVMSIDKISYNDIDSMFLIDLIVDKGGEDLSAVITPEDAKRMGLKTIPNGTFKIRAHIEDIRFDYPLKADTYTSGEDVYLYKVRGSTASEGCLVNQIPLDAVSKATTEKYAKGGTFPSMVDTIPSILPRGIENHLPVDYWEKTVSIGKWAYWMPESSSYGGSGECTGEGGLKGDWFATQLTGIPYAKGYTISTSANIYYKIRITIEREDGEIISTYVTSNKRTSNLEGVDKGRVKLVGSVVALATPPIPAVEYAVIKYIDGLPSFRTKYGADVSANEMKFVRSYAYNEYKNKMQSLVDLDTNYFTFSEEVKPISLSLSRTPVSRVTVNQPVTITARLKETITGVPVPLAPVFFSSSGGSMSSSSCVTGVTGECSITFNSNIPGLYNIRAESILFGATGRAIMSIPVSSPDFALSASPSRIATDYWGSGDTSRITAELPADIAKSVTFSTSGGSLSTTNTAFINGIAVTTLRYSAKVGDGVVVPVIVTATAKDKFGNTYTKKIQVDVVNPHVFNRRDPGVGADFIIATWNGLNNFLAGMIEDKSVPEDCSLRGSVVSCTSETKEFLFPKIQVILPASWIGMETRSGKPQIISIDKPDSSYEGETGVLKVKFQNVADMDDFFDVSATCPSEINIAPVRVLANAGEIAEASLVYSGVIADVYDCEVRVSSVGDPSMSITDSVSMNIIRKPLPEEITGLRDIPQAIDEQSKQIMQLSKTLGMLITVIMWSVVIVFVAGGIFIAYRIGIYLKGKR